MHTHSLVNEEEKLKITNLASVKNYSYMNILEISKGIMYKEPSKSQPFCTHLKTSIFIHITFPLFLSEQSSTQQLNQKKSYLSTS